MPDSTNQKPLFQCRELPVNTYNHCDKEPSISILELAQKPVSEGSEEGEGEMRVVGESGKVSWHKNFCMPGISLCFKVE